MEQSKLMARLEKSKKILKRLERENLEVEKDDDVPLLNLNEFDQNEGLMAASQMVGLSQGPVTDSEVVSGNRSSVKDAFKFLFNKKKT